MKKMIKRIIPENDVPAYFNKLHNISGKVASKFYNDAETPVTYNFFIDSWYWYLLTGKSYYLHLQYECFSRTNRP
jgi:hypothetical protein